MRQYQGSLYIGRSDVSWYDNDNWGSGWDDYYESPDTPEVNELLFGSSDVMDQHAQDLFVHAFFDGDDKAYIDLVDYMHEQYGIDFEDAFEWEDFKEWYDAQ